VRYASALPALGNVAVNVNDQFRPSAQILKIRQIQHSEDVRGVVGPHEVVVSGIAVGEGLICGLGVGEADYGGVRASEVRDTVSLTIREW